ncbi:MAG TPA: transposase [Pirellulales bacterium]|jgi:putative transposase|nr:transposase [Pirellulales bacterium]
MVFHFLNRGNDRREIFEDNGDYEAFLRVLRTTQQRIAMRVLAYCLMPNHWHLLLSPIADGELATFKQHLTRTHVRRWHLNRHSVGRGHLHQGTYKSFPVQEGDHFYTVVRYIERNALRANLVKKAERWRWGSLVQRIGQQTVVEPPELSKWPLAEPKDWLAWVNEPQTERELEAIQLSVSRGRPFGAEKWQTRTAKRLGLEFTLQPRGRPRTDKATSAKLK